MAQTPFDWWFRAGFSRLTPPALALCARRQFVFFIEGDQSASSVNRLAQEGKCDFAHRLVSIIPGISWHRYMEREGVLR
jgi:hypothetical protein